MSKKTVLAVAILGLVIFNRNIAMSMEKPAAKTQPKVEVVFCLDTTGSMGGLIEGAKRKIWSIANQIIKGKPAPELSVGLIAYRDQGDEYVTKVYPLNDDLDAVFENLQLLKADGGGDTPEHVNLALNEAVEKITWGKERNTLKLIFLVGDCPPHINYQDGYDYHRICQEAVKKDIIINTVQCGEYAETEKYWQEIARLGEGRYAKVSQTGGMNVFATPMDAELTTLNSKLEGTVLAYGDRETKDKADTRKEAMKEMASTVAVERAAYKSSSKGVSSYDLIDAIREKKVNLEQMKDEELPDEMRKMTLPLRREYLARKEEERLEVKKKIEKLVKQRADYIAAKYKESASADSFDKIVEQIVKEQAGKKGISY